MSRLLATEPRPLILNEPTRGIDVGIKEEVHRVVDALTHDGTSVIIVISDLDEMLRAVDRVVLFVDGAIVGDYPNVPGPDSVSCRMDALFFPKEARGLPVRAPSSAALRRCRPSRHPNAPKGSRSI